MQCSAKDEKNSAKWKFWAQCNTRSSSNGLTGDGTGMGGGQICSVAVVARWSKNKEGGEDPMSNKLATTVHVVLVHRTDGGL